MKLRLTMLAACTALTLVSCTGDRESRHMIVTRVTHFLVQGNGTSLNFPVFAGTMDVEEIERDLDIAEYYHQKLSALYDFKSFTLVASRAFTTVTSHEGRWQSSSPLYEYKTGESWIQFALVGFQEGQANYDFLVINQQDEQFKHHRVRVPDGQSASIGLLFDAEHNRGHLVVVSMISTAINDDLTPEAFAEFLKRKNRFADSSSGVDFVPGDQRWMDEIFGVGTHTLSIEEEAEDRKIDWDTPPGPVGGMRALLEAVEYPANAKKDGLQGRVLIEVTITETGEVGRAVVAAGVRADLDQAALDAVRSVAFTPAIKDSRPVECTVVIPIQFKLK